MDYSKWLIAENTAQYMVKTYWEYSIVESIVEVRETASNFRGDTGSVFAVYKQM